MFYSGLLTEGGRKETDMREAAPLRQQRRMKQAVQFIHKDSADLLPLDGLKKLGSSKDTVSPRGRARLGTPAAAVRRAPFWEGSSEEITFEESLKETREQSMLGLECSGQQEKQMEGPEVSVCLTCLKSSRRPVWLELKEHVRSHKHEGEKLSLPRHLKVVGQIEHLVITLGSLRLDCPAAVVEDNEKNLSLGLQTLRSLKCVINLDKHRLIMGKTDKEEIPFVETISLNEDNTSEA
uniref:Nuclear receptor interacting protein 3 n=1 Tax=Oryctolagus cuniculus TaxID=9986 RepID=G1SJ52_RABIT